MIRYYHKFIRTDAIQIPLFEYSLNFEFRYNDITFSMVSSFANDNDPMFIRRKAMTVYSTAKKTIEYLIENGFFGFNDTLEYALQVYSRIGNDTIQILGGGADTDLEHLKLEFDTMDTFGYIPDSEPTMVVRDKNGWGLTIIQTV